MDSDLATEDFSIPSVRSVFTNALAKLPIPAHPHPMVPPNSKADEKRTCAIVFLSF